MKYMRKKPFRREMLREQKYSSITEAEIGEGTKIDAFVYIEEGVKIGNEVFISFGVVFTNESCEGCRIGGIE